MSIIFLKLEKKNGEIKGKKENSIEIAKKLLKIGMTIKQVKEATNLDEEEIKKLK